MRYKLTNPLVGPKGEQYALGELLPKGFDPELAQSLLDSGGVEKVTEAEAKKMEND